MSIIESILQVLVAQWLWDVSVFSNPWMYWPLLVPVMFFFIFFIFFIFKWMALTAPLWLPLAIIINQFKRR